MSELNSSGRLHLLDRRRTRDLDREPQAAVDDFQRREIPRLAARIVNELRDKVGGLALVPASPVAALAGGGVGLAEAGAGADAVSALVNLGYRRAEAFGAVAAVARKLGDGAALDALIRGGLQELGQGLRQGVAR